MSATQLRIAAADVTQAMMALDAAGLLLAVSHPELTRMLRDDWSSLEASRAILRRTVAELDEQENRP